MGQYIEYLVILLIGLGAIFGFVKGFVVVFLSWFSIFFGIVISMNFSFAITKTLFPNNSSNILLIFAVGLVLFSIIYLFMTKVAKSVQNFFYSKDMKGLDHILGGVLGACQMMIIVGLGVYWVSALNWADLSSYPIAMFSAYWAERIVLLVGTKFSLANKLINS